MLRSLHFNLIKLALPERTAEKLHVTAPTNNVRVGSHNQLLNVKNLPSYTGLKTVTKLIVKSQFGRLSPYSLNIAAKVDTGISWR